MGFTAPNFDQLASVLRHELLFDERNFYAPERLEELGWADDATGRGESQTAVV